jgi:FtsX-like permease family/MacB-like periplasmic core domain
MSKSVLGVAWYRFRATFRRQRKGYLGIVLLVGLVGGVAMGAVAAARSTQSSFPTLLRSVDASDLGGAVSFYNPSIGSKAGYYPGLLRTIENLPRVKNLESEVGLGLLPLGANGLPIPAANWIADGSVNGLGFDEDRLIVAHGRLPNPQRPDEFVMGSATAKLWGVHLGEVVTFGVYTNAQSVGNPGGLRPISRLTAKLVGVGTTSAENLVEDQFDADAGESQTVFFTPALTKRLLRCCADDTIVGAQVDGGSRYDATVSAEIAQVVPKGVPFSAVLVSTATARAERAIRPESIALAVFGGIAALAALVIGGQVIGRRLRTDEADLAVLRALGAGPAMTLSDGLIGVLAAVIAGSLLAAVVAISLSPVAPLGPARPYLPVRVSFDWTVIGCGVAVLVVSMCGVALAFAYRAAPQRSSAQRGRAFSRGSATARVAESAGLPAPAVAGIRFALEPGSGRNTVPVRSAILGTVLAVVVVTAIVTFGASLTTLVSHPPLYGWNWDYALFNGGGDIPVQAEPLLDKDPVLSSWVGVYFGILQIDNQQVPVMGADPGVTISPPLLSGHGFDASDQVVLGALTLAQLHKRVGGTVEVRSAGTAPTQLRIVGTATMPAFGGAGGVHMEMGSGALLDYELIPPGQRNLYDQPQPGPNAILMRTRSGTSVGSVDSSINAIIAKLGGGSGGGGPSPVLGPQRPAEIISYSNLGATPALLGGALAAGAVVALGLTLVATVRRRRRDLAVLKTLGFTNGQIAATVAWQATVAVAIGTVFGAPLGVALGRSLWDLFAREINAVPDPSAPFVSVALIAVGALAVANLVAAVPGRIAARTHTAHAFRTE